MIVEYKLTEEAKKYYKELKPSTVGSAAIDLYCVDFTIVDSHLNRHGEHCADYYILYTGLHIHIKDSNYVGLIIPRSGNSVKLMNTVGVIDSDYQGELLLRVKSDKRWNSGERVAQLLIMPVAHPTFQLVEEFSEESERGNNGFGSTGTK